VKEDKSLGDPNWKAVMDTTSLDLSKLLPSDKEFMHLAHPLNDSEANPKDVKLKAMWNEVKRVVKRLKEGNLEDVGLECSRQGTLELSTVSSDNLDRESDGQAMHAPQGGGKHIAQDFQGSHSQAIYMAQSRQGACQANLLAVDALLRKYQVLHHGASILRVDLFCEHCCCHCK
jgi:hypothetical protein